MKSTLYHLKNAFAIASHASINSLGRVALDEMYEAAAHRLKLADNLRNAVPAIPFTPVDKFKATEKQYKDARYEAVKHGVNVANLPRNIVGGIFLR